MKKHFIIHAQLIAFENTNIDKQRINCNFSKQSDITAINYTL